MNIEIDQSGKIEQLNTLTTIGASNNIKIAIKISVTEKRKLIIRARKSLILRKDLYSVLFAILVFILISKLKIIPPIIIIDEEYTGKDDIIRETLTKLILRKSPRWFGQVKIKQIGKSSKAHDVAWSSHSKNKSRKYKVLKIVSEDVLKFLK